jgi:hypothetical protein
MKPLFSASLVGLATSAFTALFLALTAPAVAQPVGNRDVVAQAKAELLSRNVDVTGACGAFRITALVAYKLRPTYGFLIKQGGNRAIVREDGSCVNGDNPGPGYATDYLIDSRTGFGYDILSDGGSANGPQWGEPETDAEMVHRNLGNFEPAFAWVGVTTGGPDNPPPPPPADTTLAKRVEAIENFDAVVVAKYNELINALNDLQARVGALTATIQAVVADATSLRNRVDVLEARKTVSSCSASAFGIPLSCKLQ